MVRNHIMKSNLNFHTYTISKNIFEGGTDDNRFFFGGTPVYIYSFIN